MRRLAAVPLLVASLTAAAAPDASRPAAADPCVAAKVPIPQEAGDAIAAARAELDAYRASWRAACEPARGPADVAALLSEAEVLVTDVRIGRAVGALARAVADDGAWPLPGIHRHAGVVDVDWATFAAFVSRGTAEDQRFFRGLARATRADGDGSWLGEPAPDGEPCLRLGDLSWSEVVQGIEEMERSRGEVYARRAGYLREALLATLGALGEGGIRCGCVRGDPLPALDAIAASQGRLGTPARREIVAKARAAADALRAGKTRVSWLRDAPGAPVTGCGAGTR